MALHILPLPVNRAPAAPAARYQPDDLPASVLIFGLVVVLCGHLLSGVACVTNNPSLPFVPWVNVDTMDVNPMTSAKQYVYDHWVKKSKNYQSAVPYSVEWDQQKAESLPKCEAGPGYHPWSSLEDGEWQSIKTPVWPVEACAYAGEIGMREYFPSINVNESTARSLLRWQPSKCGMPILGQEDLKKCFANKKVAIAGDSIVREWYCFMRDQGIEIEYINHRYPTMNAKIDATTLPEVLEYDFGRTRNPTRDFDRETLRDMCGRNTPVNTDWQRGLSPNLTHIIIVPSTAHWLAKHSWKSVYLGKGPSTPMPLNTFTEQYENHLNQLYDFFSARQPNAKLVWTSPTPAAFIEVNEPLAEMGPIRLGVCPSSSLPVRNPGTLRRSWNLVTHLSERLAAFVKGKGEAQSVQVAANSSEFHPNSVTTTVTNTTVKRTEKETFVTTVTTIVTTSVVPNVNEVTIIDEKQAGPSNTFLNMTAVMSGRMDGNLGLTQRQRWDCTHTCPEMARWAIQILARSLGC